MTPGKVAVIADSTCDIPEDLLKKHGIQIIPQGIIWGDETYQDRVDLSSEEFYQRLENDPVHPKTTLPSPETILNAYQNAFQQGAESILVFTVSSQMSGTYQLAVRLADDVSGRIDVVDSRGPTMSLGWQVLAAARCQEVGGNHQEMMQAAEQVRRSLVQVVFMNTLEYLHKGGRIGRAALLVGSLLDFKPLVEIDHQSGVVEPAGRVRTRTKGLEVLWQRFFSQLEVEKELHIAVLHGNAREDAQQLAERIHQEYQPEELIINLTGPVLGVNTGPGALAFCGYAV